nr:histidine kinase [uncultured Clostridium sp.]
MIEQTKTSIQNITDTHMSELDTRMENTQLLLYYFMTENVDFQRIMHEKEKTYNYESAKYKFYYSLKKMASLTDGGDGYFFYIKNIDETLVYDEKPSESGHLYKYMNVFLKEQFKSGISSGWHIYDIVDKQSLIFVINANDVVYGGWINLDSLKNKIENGIEYSHFTSCFSEEKKNNSNKRWVYVTSEKKGIYLILNVEKNEIIGEISIFQKIINTMVFIYLILIPVLYIFLRVYFLHPINQINFAHKQIQAGNQDFRILAKGKSIEFEEVYLSFNRMAENLKLLRIEGYEKEIEKKKMELRNLQLQIRPHFLLNTFNFIYTMAQRKETNEIQDVIIYLSEYFRYIFRNDKDLDIFSKELSLVKGYVNMISIRYNGDIKVVYDVDFKISFIRIPPLLIHNFIENAVKYGKKLGEVLHVSLTGHYKDKMVIFEINDDGIGMDQETLDYNNKMLHGEIEPAGSNAHVGLLNSIKRLKYFYGEMATIEIESERGNGTLIRIMFPYNLEAVDETFNDQ